MARNRKNKPTRFLNPAQLVWVGLLLIGLVGCQAEAAQQPETATVDQEPAPVEESAAPTEAAESTEMAEAEEAEAAPENQCLVCHTDQASLMNTADPVEDTESESSGEG